MHGLVQEPAALAFVRLRIRSHEHLCQTFADELPVRPRELVTVVGNLVDNAVDAVMEQNGGTHRRVAVHLEGDTSHVRVVVEDSGAGVRPEDAERVLERGWSTKASGGRGIGLALVGQVARRHHGTVEVAVSDLGGARFTVTLGPADVPLATELGS